MTTTARSNWSDCTSFERWLDLTENRAGRYKLERRMCGASRSKWTPVCQFDWNKVETFFLTFSPDRRGTWDNWRQRSDGWEHHMFGHTQQCFTLLNWYIVTQLSTWSHWPKMKSSASRLWKGLLIMDPELRPRSICKCKKKVQIGQMNFYLSDCLQDMTGVEHGIQLQWTYRRTGEEHRMVAVITDGCG